jgi:hypothetical protein
MITGVQVTLLTVVVLDQEILIPDVIQQPTENHFYLQIMPSTILKDNGMLNQIVLKT